MTVPVEGPREPLADIARRLLGPASAAWVASPQGAAEVQARLAAGRSAEDAVLGAVHAAVATHRALASEFMAHFDHDLRRIAELELSNPLRGFTEPVDLAQSVAKDIWPRMDEVAFTTRPAFLGLLAQRIRWKTRDKARDRDRQAALAGDDEAGEPADTATGGPMTINIAREDREGLARLLHRLGPADMLLLQWHVSGVPVDEVARRRGVSEESAKRMLRRAIERARRLMDGGRDHG